MLQHGNKVCIAVHILDAKLTERNNSTQLTDRACELYPVIEICYLLLANNPVAFCAGTGGSMLCKYSSPVNG